MLRSIPAGLFSVARLSGANAPLAAAAASAARHASNTAAAADGQGPVTLIFGATGGIGSALAHRLAALKHQQSSNQQAPSAIVLCADGEEKLKSLQQQLKEGGDGGVHAISADAREPAAVEGVVQQVLQRYGRLDGVVNCVGSVVARSALATDLEELHETLDVNLVTSFNIVKASVRGMIQEEGHHHLQHNNNNNNNKSEPRQQAAASSTTSSSPGRRGGGSIVLVSAALASHGIPAYEAMSAAKAAVEGLARSAAATYSQHNIRVNCVAPGLTRTPQTQRFTDNAKVAGASQEMHPLKELAEPDQVASALEFFLRPENDFVTGQVLAVDGGLSTLHPHRAQEYGV